MVSSDVPCSVTPSENPMEETVVETTTANCEKIGKRKRNYQSLCDGSH
jgi:hypothetical protein